MPRGRIRDRRPRRRRVHRVHLGLDRPPQGRRRRRTARWSTRSPWFARDLPWHAGEVACLRSSPAFVDSLWELFGPLADGVPLVIATADEMRDPRLLAAMAARHRVTRMVVVPSLLRTLLELGARAARPDAVARDQRGAQAGARRARSAPRARLAAGQPVRRVGDRRSGRRPRGRAERRAAAHADRQADREHADLRPRSRPGAAADRRARRARASPASACPMATSATPPTATGSRRSSPASACIAPATAAAGATTACSSTSAASTTCSRSAASASIPARSRPRCSRIPSVAAAVVTAQPGFDGEARLVAYIVARGSCDAAASCAGACARGCPRPMIPTSFVALDALPLGPTGKVDRAALPALAPIAVASRPPQGAIEHAVALAWELLLGRPVGAEDDFFAAGGQSLLAAQLGARLAERFGVELPLPVLFERPTVAAQAAWLERARCGSPPRPTIPRIGRRAGAAQRSRRSGCGSRSRSRRTRPRRSCAPRCASRARSIVDRLEAAIAPRRRAPGRAAHRVRRSGGAIASASSRLAARSSRRAIVTGRRPRRSTTTSIRAHLDDERERPFDLASGPPWRTRLLRFAPTRPRPARDDAPPRHRRHLARGVERRAPRARTRRATCRARRVADSAADVARWQRRSAESRSGRLARVLARRRSPARRRSTCRSSRRAPAGPRPRRSRARAICRTTRPIALVGARARRAHDRVRRARSPALGAWLHGLTGRSDLTIGTIAAGRDRPEVRPPDRPVPEPAAAAARRVRRSDAARARPPRRRHRARRARPRRRPVRAHRRRRQPRAPAVPPAAVRHRAQPSPDRRSAAARRPRGQSRPRRHRAGRALRADDPHDRAEAASSCSSTSSAIASTSRPSRAGSRVTSTCCVR